MKTEIENNNLIFECPHCELIIIVNLQEVNCKIFRHGVYKNNFNQISPHAPKNECDFLKENDLILGCGKPFQLHSNDNEWSVQKCDYI